MLALPLRSGDHGRRVEIEEVLCENIRVLRLHPEGFEHIGGEIAFVERDDHARVAADGCGQYVVVIWIGQ